jgi:hypothetical protein
MYHGIPLNTDLLIFALGVIIWIIRGISKIVKQFKRPPTVNAQRLPQVPPPLQTSPSQTSAAQALPTRAVPLVSPREMPRQPQAGGPAVPKPATSRSIRREEQTLIASEPAALNASLLSPANLPTVQPNSLFAGTDDLIRAMILQEVLGPPLCRRSSSSSQSSPPPQ